MTRKKKEPSVVDPITRGIAATDNLDIPSFNGRYPDVVRLDPLIYSDPPVKQPVMVQTGIDIMTREPIYKPAPEVPEEKWNTPDRRPYLVEKYITGSYNFRPLILEKGDIVYLNDGEYSVFKPYVTEVKCG